MISAAFAFSLFLFNLGVSAINEHNVDLDEMHGNIKDIEEDVGSVKSDISFIKGQLSSYQREIRTWYNATVP